ncbi:MAG: hypothetical protein HPY58_04970 [Firmicutes bacterium]|nr:hypothetical protein [Bacillota bacterium]
MADIKRFEVETDRGRRVYNWRESTGSVSRWEPPIDFLQVLQGGREKEIGSAKSEDEALAVIRSDVTSSGETIKHIKTE